MIEVYFYIHEYDAVIVAECGMSLQRWHDREVIIAGEKKKCISALLNPRDDLDKYRSRDYRCLKINLPANTCYAAEKYFYNAGLSDDRIMELYINSIIPVENYVYGTYRLPECLITTTMLPDRISITGSKLDSPVLFGSSEELYINNIIELNKEEDSGFSDAMLYFFYCGLAERNKIVKIEDTDKKIAVFVDKDKGKTIVIKVPEI